MVHAGHHEQPRMALRSLQIWIPARIKGRRLESLVVVFHQRVEVVDAALRRDQRIGPAVIQDELAAMLAKLAEIGRGRVQHLFELVIDRVDVVVKIEIRKVRGAPGHAKASAVHPIEQAVEGRLRKLLL